MKNAGGKPRLGKLKVKQARQKYGVLDVVTGTWRDTNDTEGTWLVDQKREITGYYNKESDNAKIADLYIERDGVQGFSKGDRYVGYAQAAVSTAGYGEWNWSSGAQIGDYFSGNGAQREDAGKFFFSDTSFL